MIFFPAEKYFRNNLLFIEKNISLHCVEPAKPLIAMLKWAGRFIYELFEQNESAYPLGRALSID